MLDADFALFNVDQLVTAAPGSHRAALGSLGVIKHAALAGKGTKIVWVGLMDEFHDHVRLSPNATVVNSHGRTVLPGFVDAHTHPVFAGERINDFYSRAGGEPYEDQVEHGIMHTVRETRAADEDALLGLAFDRTALFLAHGTTTIRANTGYGLSRDAELKSLRVLNRLQHLQCVKIVPSFLGAHVVPSDFSGDAGEYAHEVAEWLPEARESASFVDVWCEAEAFTVDQCRRILERAGDLGFSLTAHANELDHGDGITLAAELGARSVDHCVYVDDDDIAALVGSRTVAVLLPGTTFFLGSDRYAPARRLLDAGVTVALGTDYNPGTSHIVSMQFILTLAVLRLGMSPEEAILGATINGARAVGLEDVVGSLEPGKFCDFGIYRVSDYRAIPYHCAVNKIETVVANGSVAFSDGQPLSVPAPLVHAS